MKIIIDIVRNHLSASQINDYTPWDTYHHVDDISYFDEESKEIDEKFIEKLKKISEMLNDVVRYPEAIIAEIIQNSKYRNIEIEIVT